MGSNPASDTGGPSAIHSDNVPVYVFISVSASACLYLCLSLSLMIMMDTQCGAAITHLVRPKGDMTAVGYIEHDPEDHV